LAAAGAACPAVTPGDPVTAGIFWSVGLVQPVKSTVITTSTTTAMPVQGYQENVFMEVLSSKLPNAVVLY
jgi:hypothetical protein